MIQSSQATALRVRRASEIAATGDLAVGVDRYLLESPDSGGLVGWSSRSWHHGYWLLHCTDTAVRMSTASFSKGGSASSRTTKK
jgi:hypothetical protein